MRSVLPRFLPALLCAVAALGASAAHAQTILTTRDIPYFMRSPEARAATLKLCRNDHRFDRSPDCANAASAEDRLWELRLRAGAPAPAGVQRVPSLDTWQLSPTYWAQNRLARKSTLVTCRNHPGMMYPAKVCAAAEQGDTMDQGGRP